MPHSPGLSPPPAREVHRVHRNPQLLQSLSRQVAIVGALDGSIRVVALGVGGHPRKGQAENRGEERADLVLGEAVFGGELEDCGERGAHRRRGGEVEDRDVLTDPPYILRVRRVP